ncbi:MAG: response regulator [Holophagaceae bacterium]|nr:response regulator [Holophagaceae bacterium]
MMDLLERLQRWLGPGSGSTIEQRLFRGLTLIGGLLSILVVVPLNFPQSLPGFVNGAVLLFGALCLGLFGATFRGHYGMKLLFFLHLATLDLIWFGNGGSQGSIGMFLITAAMYLVIFFKGRTRWFMLGLYLANGLALLWVERLRPSLVWPFEHAGGRFIDLVTGFILSSVVCVIILWAVLKEYHGERERLREALEAQEASEARFRSLVVNAPIPIAISNAQGGVTYVNRRFEDVLGYTLEDLPDLETWWIKAYPNPEVRKRVAAQWEAAMVQASARGIPVPPAEFPVTRKDGGLVHLEIQAALVGEHLLVMFTDVSERRRSEEALRQTQKLESLGVLAGGIAHDFNNLLSAMLGNLNLAQMKLPIGGASGPFLENMEGTIRKAAELTRQMLAYSGRGRFVVEPVDLNRLVAEITHLLAVSISKRVRLEYDLVPGLPAIEADSAQLQQVVMNLVTNASEAIGETEGVIRIATGLSHFGEREIETVLPGQGLEPGPYVSLRVTDTGCGMEPEVRARIFDPFFSTKGSGRGLGLSAMLGIVRGHRAGIEIHSDAGLGSSFLIHFRASQAKVADSGRIEAGAHKDRFQGKVLLVDDEADLRFSFGSMLQHLGFQVVAARDGLEALERFQKGEYTLVFMDLTMPRMDGKEAFLQMKARDSEVRVILASGYSEGEAIETLHGLRPAGFIQKPFSLQALTRAVERALG